MKEQPLSIIRQPQTFTLTVDADNYYTEALSWEIHNLLYNMGNSGFTLQQEEDSDLGDIISAVDTWGSDLRVYLDNFMSASSNEEAHALLVPAIPAIGGGLIKWAAKGALWYVVSKIITTVIDVAFRWLGKKINPKPTEPESLSALVSVLRQGLNDGGTAAKLDRLIEAILSLDTVVDIPGLEVYMRSGFITHKG